MNSGKLRPLRVLVVEDSPDDAELIHLALERGGFSVKAARVETAEELESALAAEAWEAVISDHSLPTLTAPQALHMVRTRGGDIPFIVVSGTIDENVAAELMRDGANDYLLKSSLVRLAPAILRELRERENRRARQRAEWAAHQLAALVRSSSDAIIGVSLEGSVTTWNPSAERLYGWRAHEVVGRSISLVIPSERAAEAADARARVRRGEDVPAFETERLRKDGTRVPVSIAMSPVRTSDGTLIGISAIARDITESRRAAQELARDALLLDNVRDSVIVTDLNGVVTYWNDGATRLFGWSAEEMVGRDYLERFPPAMRGQLRAEFKAHAADVEWSGEYCDYRKDGSRVWVSARVTRVTGADGQFMGKIGLAQDITARKEAELALRQSEARFRAICEASPMGIFLADVAGGNVYANPALLRQFGIPPEEKLGSGWMRAVHSRDRKRIFSAWRCAIDERREFELGFRLARADGSAIQVMVWGAPVWHDKELLGFVGMTLDVTERQQLEEQLRQAQKLEAVGQLAGGVAHDFNNILAVISGYSDLVFHQLPADSGPRGMVDQIRKSGDRAAGLTRQLLAFSRKQVLAPQRLDLNQVIGDLERMLQRLIGEDVRMTFQLGPGIGAVYADRGQIEQVLVNLCVNARDAMPQGGTLRIRTQALTLEAGEALTATGLLRREYVHLSVADSGCGMTPEVQAQLFEPFFTTKPPGQGTGLGLAVVHGIVSQSGGRIALESAPGEGTTFSIFLPMLERLEVVEDTTRGTESAPPGSETILLVEDEESVRSLLQTVLEQNGYRLLVAGHGKEALAIAGRYQGAIDLLVTDVVMPEIGGRLVAERLREQRPELRTLYVSGYTDDAVVRHGVMVEETHFLQKPFTPLELAHKVREVLSLEFPPR